MYSRMPQYFSGHVAAFTGVLMLHGGLVAWQMMPTPPVVLPQQQVIKVAMVTARMVHPAPQPEPVVQEVAPVPPKAEGMKKVAPLPKPQVKAPPPEPVQKREEKVEQPPAQAQPTAAMQSEEADNRDAALTEPVAAAYLKNPPPVYPRAALRRKQQGTVLVAVLVDIHGQPLRVSLDCSSGHEKLDEAALDAVRKWKFIPARRGSELVEASVVVPVEFRIN